MRSGDITRVTGVPELTWCYNRNSTPLLDRAELAGHVTWVYKHVASKQNFNYQTFTMTTTTALEQQIAALVCQLEETKEAEKREEARREAEATAEKAHKEEEQCRLQAEAECVRRNAEASH